ncbi:unnamed protein product [Caenorhabditis nigoni]
MVVMARVLILLALLQTSVCGSKSHYRVYGSLYCPLKTEWKWSAYLWDDMYDNNGKEIRAKRINCKAGAGSDQYVTYFMEGDIDEKYSETGFEITIRHTCHSDGKLRKFLGQDAIVDLSHGDSYFFKASHLGNRVGYEHKGDVKYITCT